MGFSVPTISQINAVRANLSTIEATRDSEEAERALKDLFKECANTGRLGAAYVYRTGAVAIVRNNLVAAGWVENNHFTICQRDRSGTDGSNPPWHIKFSY